MANRGDTLKRGGLRGREELVEKGGSPGNIAKIKFIPSLQGRSLQGRLARAETSGPRGDAAATATGIFSVPFCSVRSGLQSYLCYVYLDIDIGEK